jgi:hypothetical protein
MLPFHNILLLQPVIQKPKTSNKLAKYKDDSAARQPADTAYRTATHSAPSADTDIPGPGIPPAAWGADQHSIPGRAADAETAQQTVP